MIEKITIIPNRNSDKQNLLNSVKSLLNANRKDIKCIIADGKIIELNELEKIMSEGMLENTARDILMTLCDNEAIVKETKIESKHGTYTLKFNE